MNCSRSHKLLEALAAGRLELPSADLDSHLADCPACRELRQRMDGLETGLRQAWSDGLPAAAIKGRLLASAQRQQATGRPARWWWAAACAAAAAVLVLLVTQGSWTRFAPGDGVSVRLDLPEGTRLVREPEMYVVKAVDR